MIPKIPKRLIAAFNRANNDTASRIGMIHDLVELYATLCAIPLEMLEQALNAEGASEFQKRSDFIMGSPDASQDILDMVEIAVATRNMHLDYLRQIIEEKEKGVI